MKYAFVALLMAVSAASCFNRKAFDKTVPPPAPDYSNAAHWIALPDRKDAGDTLVPGGGLKDGQGQAQADVFYIHPTLYLKGKKWNADLNWKKINKKGDDCTRFQGTAYNSSCRVYAPRYRQAVLRSYYPQHEADGKKALQLAYSDVKKAFEYYLEHYNQGRPVIIAGHSQGAGHATQLLKDFFDGKPLQEKLVAGYPIGATISAREFKHIPLADSASQTGCYVTWNAVAWGTKPERGFVRYKDCACVNPLSWKTGTEAVPATLNKGGLSFRYKGIDPALCSARCIDGLLWISKPNKKGYYKLGKSYHVVDYNLFYINLRENAALRVKSYIERKEK